MLRCSGSSQNPCSSVLNELQLSNGLLWKTIRIILLAGDKGMNKSLSKSSLETKIQILAMFLRR